MDLTPHRATSAKIGINNAVLELAFIMSNSEFHENLVFIMPALDKKRKKKYH